MTRQEFIDHVGSTTWLANRDVGRAVETLFDSATLEVAMWGNAPSEGIRRTAARRRDPPRRPV